MLLRHGESTWNRENRFTGWTDVDLSEKGVTEAHNAGKVRRALSHSCGIVRSPLPTQSLVKEGYTFDVAFTSVLKRAIKTLNIVQDEMNLDWIPVHRHWCAPTRPALYR